MDTFRDVAKKAVDAIASGTALESPSLAGVVDAKPLRAAEPPVVAADEPLTPTPVHASSSWSNRGSAFLDKWFGGRDGAMKAPDVWSKGTGVTKFRGSDRYDKASSGDPSVHSILAEASKDVGSSPEPSPR